MSQYGNYPNKRLKVAELRDLIDRYDRHEISISRFAELINEKIGQIPISEHSQINMPYKHKSQLFPIDPSIKLY